MSRVGSRYQGGFTYSIGAVSLLDLGSAATPMASQVDNMVAWIGGQQNGASAVWIEINREKLDPQCFFDATAARARFNEVGIGTNFIAGLEAYHLGRVPTGATGRIVMIARFDRSVFRVAEGMTPGAPDAAMTFDAAAPLPPPGTLARMHYDRTIIRQRCRTSVIPRGAEGTGSVG